MSRVMELKSIYPKLRQDQITKELGYSGSTLQRYRIDKKLKNPLNSKDSKRPQKTSNDFERPQKIESVKLVTNADFIIARSANK